MPSDSDKKRKRSDDDVGERRPQPQLWHAVIDPMVTLYREQLEASEEMRRALERHKNDSAEHARYLTRRLNTADGYIQVLEQRLDDLTAVVVGLLNASRNTADDAQEHVRMRAEDSPESDFLWRLLLEVDTENGEDEEELTLEEELSEDMLRELDAFF